LELEKQLEHQAAVHAKLDQDRTEQETIVASLVTQYTAVAGALAEHRQQTTAARLQLDHIVREIERLDGETRSAEERISVLECEAVEHRGQQIEAEAAAAKWAAELQCCEQAVPALKRRHAELQTAATGRQITAAKCEQRVEMLRHQVEQAKRTEQEREGALSDIRQQLAERQCQLRELQTTLQAEERLLADLFAHKERQAEEIASHTAGDRDLRQTRTKFADQIREQRQQLAVLQTQQHKIDVAVSRLRHERQTLCERMQEDYGIDLAAEADVAASLRDADGTNGNSIPNDAASVAGFHASLRHGEPSIGETRPQVDREAVEREIAELREQISGIGAINMEALNELEQLEGRFEALSTQYRDLVESKEALERIIQRINVDSRQVFVATLETVRGHFQELFRRLFGGGEADIVVDEAEDVLECGIEIVARPPGKEACSISLLSGGEKTLTCVALLLAVFRSKPSPFCVLDEVDAALDEANIARFVGVLKEFLSFTQFVVVTHSKKTMAGADTIYGVTMEESGVSKRVSVRFEDVSEDGHISLAAMRRAA
jgi:chromosome segregation protein